MHASSDGKEAAEGSGQRWEASGGRKQRVPESKKREKTRSPRKLVVRGSKELDRASSAGTGELGGASSERKKGFRGFKQRSV